MSQACAEEMVRGAFDKTAASLVVAVTGIAGPTGGSPEKPVGTVWASFGARYGEIYSIKLQLSGNREVIVLKATGSVLGHLYRLLKRDIVPNSSAAMVGL